MDAKVLAVTAKKLAWEIQHVNTSLIILKEAHSLRGSGPEKVQVSQKKASSYSVGDPEVVQKRGFAEISGDVLEADFWTEMIPG